MNTPTVAHADELLGDTIGSRPISSSDVIAKLGQQTRSARHIRAVADSLLGFSELERLRKRCSQDPQPSSPRIARAQFLETLLQSCEISVCVDGSLPAAGSTLVVANHPFGLLDAIVLSALMSRARADYMFVANALLARLPDVSGWVIPVDILSTRSTKVVKRNTAALRAALSHLRSGGMLAMFPAGVVAHRSGVQSGVEEARWSSHAITLARRSSAAIVPVRFHGENPLWWQVAGLLSSRFRTAGLVRAFLSSRGSQVRCTIGAARDVGEFAALAADHAAARLREIAGSLKASTA